MTDVQLLSTNEQTFEAGQGNWVAYGAGSCAPSTAQFRTGTQSLRIVASTAFGASIVLPATDPGVGVVTIGFWAKGTAGHMWYVLCNAASGGQSSTTLTPSTGLWQYVTLSFEAVGSMVYTLYVLDNTSGGSTFFIDDCSVIENIPIGIGGSSGVITVTPLGVDYWLVYPLDETFNCRLSQVTADEIDEEYEEATLQIIGRGRKKDYGTRWGYNGTLTAQLWDRPDKTARQQRQALEALKAKLADVYIRNPFGDAWHVTIGQTHIGRIAGLGQREYVNLTLPYAEVAT
jgi:hypothetical protein